MTYIILMTVAVLAPFAAGCLAGSLAVWLLWPSLSTRLAHRPPVQRARALFALRALPVFSGLISTLVVFPRFLACEPVTTTERPGVVLVAFSLVTAGIVGGAIVRAVGDILRARAWLRTIRARGKATCLGTSRVPVWRIDDSAPVMALVGSVRPQIVAAGELIDHVTVEELDVMLRHELAHRTRRDNVVAGLLHALPDPLCYTKRGFEIAESWRQATEEAADDLAAHGDRSRLLLASGLVRIARLAQGALPDIATSSPLAQGSLERRVRRLLVPPPSAGWAAGSSPGAFLLVGVALFGVLISQELVGETMDGIVETAVQTLP
jgi:hypothetical protein